MQVLFRTICFVLLFLMLMVWEVYGAVEKRYVERDYISFRLVEEKQEISPRGGTRFKILLKAGLKEGWHIYWRYPGDGGLATKIKIETPKEIKEINSRWERPHTFDTVGLITYGYSNRASFVYDFVVKEAIKEKAIRLKVRVEYLLCEKVCLAPRVEELDIVLKVGSERKNGLWEREYGSFKNKLPLKVENANLLSYGKLRFRGGGVDGVDGVAGGDVDSGKSKVKKGERKWIYIKFSKGLGGTLKERLGKRGEGIYFFGESTKMKASVGQEYFEYAGDSYLKVGVLGYPKGLGGVLVIEGGIELSEGVLGLVAGKFESYRFKDLGEGDELLLKEVRNGLGYGEGADGVADGVVDGVVDGEGEVIGSTSLLVVLLFGFIGGIILNLMPCVLPVMSLKILSFAEQGGKSGRGIKVNGLLFTLGVLVSLWILTGFLILLKHGGDIRGWGYQLQDSLFVMLLGVFFLVFALNLFGVFEIGVGLSKYGGVGSKYGSMLKSFMMGVMITISATPCSAPFLGTALGFAIAQDDVIILLIFTSIGLGISFPYLVIAFKPKLLNFIPKPGNWMIVLKEVMGFLLLLTTLYFVWILGKQSDIDKVGYYLVSLILISVGLWVYGKTSVVGSRGFVVKGVGILLSIFFVGLGFYIIRDSYAGGGVVSGKEAEGRVKWLSYNAEEVMKYRKSGEIVFINFTAAWCVTCQTNKLALKSDRVEERFNELKIKAFEADWTKRNDKIGQALRKLGKNAVPVYALYKPGERVVLLPELLTEGIVLKYLE